MKLWEGILLGILIGYFSYVPIKVAKKVFKNAYIAYKKNNF